MSEQTYWEERKADSHDDWGGNRKFLESYRYSINHPHRELIVDALKDIEFWNVLEVGCCNGVNLAKIRTAFPLAWLEGQDINKEAIKDAKDWFQAEFKVCKLPKIDALDKSFDIVLADACLMYVEDIDKVLSEMKRVAKKQVIICDWYTENEEKINYSQTRNWKKRLKNLGFTNINIKPFTPFTWPEEKWQKYGRFISAQV